VPRCYGHGTQQKCCPPAWTAGKSEQQGLLIQRPLQTATPIIHLLLSSVLGAWRAVLGLQPSFELLSVAINLGQLIIRELTSLLLALPESCFQFPCTGSQFMNSSYLRIYFDGLVGAEPLPVVLLRSAGDHDHTGAAFSESFVALSDTTILPLPSPMRRRESKFTATSRQAGEGNWGNGRRALFRPRPCGSIGPSMSGAE